MKFDKRFEDIGQRANSVNKINSVFLIMARLTKYYNYENR